CFAQQYRLNQNLGYNRLLSTPLRQAMSGARYMLTRKGPLGEASFSSIGFLKTDPEQDRPDAQVLLAPYSIEPLVPGKTPGMENGRCGYPAGGTCAMGPDAQDVVDPELRVRGVSGLRVVDCSVMPIMVSGNLNAPIMAMAWRAADLILDES